jgi:putative acyl-CoA dehydrogenase
VIEDHVMPRLFRESPINAIWEGSGNVQCLDLLRALRTTPEAVAAVLDEVQTTRGADLRLDRHVAGLQRALADEDGLEYRARDVVTRMAVAIQGSLLVRHGHPAVTEAFLASRTATDGDHGGSAHLYGALPPGLDVATIVERAAPTR